MSARKGSQRLQVVCVIAGGDLALKISREGIEDDPRNGERDLQSQISSTTSACLSQKKSVISTQIRRHMFV